MTCRSKVVFFAFACELFTCVSQSSGRSLARVEECGTRAADGAYLGNRPFQILPLLAHRRFFRDASWQFGMRWQFVSNFITVYSYTFWEKNATIGVLVSIVPVSARCAGATRAPSRRPRRRPPRITVHSQPPTRRRPRPRARRRALCVFSRHSRMSWSWRLSPETPPLSRIEVLPSRAAAAPLPREC